jgi:redox-sensitive bicupin YhaK (pirin superfamily)
MNSNRNLIRIYTPQGQPGFLGAGHTARPVVAGNFVDTDPFIVLMDDLLDKKDDVPVGGPHPHAGFETVSLLLEGEIGDERHRMKGGDFEIMTAGSGIVHTETIDKQTRLRLLQLWLNLPRKDRWVLPRLQNLSLAHVPSSNQDGVSIKLYSGTLAGMTSPVQNYTPLIVADITLNEGASTTFTLPAAYNAFLYILEGSMQVGEEEKPLKKDQVGWLDRFEEGTESSLKVAAGKEGVRFVLYAGKPTGDTIVSHGPFIADAKEEIQDLYQDYRRGRLQHISSVPESQRLFL